MKYSVRDLSLAEGGLKKIQFAEGHMPVLLKVRARFEKEKPLKGIKIAACLHVTKETAVLVRTLKAGGAQVALCASNPLSTQDDVAASLVEHDKIPTFAVKGASNEDYYKQLNAILDFGPHIALDDGADVISIIHSKRKDLLKNVIGGQEETTTGIIRLRAMAKDGELKFPVIAVNDTPTKHMFDNYYGTGQSTIDGILRASNILFAGKTVVVAGYGFCGKGIAKVADGMGSKVIVTEVDAIEGLRAHMDGFAVMQMRDAAKIGDIFITVTGNKDVITKDHVKLMRDGALMANSGHFDCEINVNHLNALAKRVEEVRPSLKRFVLDDKRSVYLVADGRLVNLGAAEGHPSEVMDLSFSDQALVSEYLVKSKGKLKAGVHEVPKEIDQQVASLKLESMGVQIDVLTAEQEKYLESWDEGT